MIPEAAIEAALTREQVTAILEAAAPHMLAESLNTIKQGEK